MSSVEVKDYPCDVCGSTDCAEIPAVARYTGGKPIHVCQHCGFVYVRSRRTFRAIADDWSENLFGSHYTARVPYMRARHVFLAETLHKELGGLEGKRVCDIGAGEGEFLALLRGADYGADVFGIEPSRANGVLMEQRGIGHFVGPIEDFVAADKGGSKGSFDVVTCMWTLENCEKPRDMLAAAHEALRDGGHLLLATSSRILVPFKKPLHYYLAPADHLDTHSFRFSANTQRAILAQCGFEVTFTNRYIDHDILCMIARKVPVGTPVAWQGDDWQDVIAYFDRWDEETRRYYPEA